MHPSFNNLFGSVRGMRRAVIFIRAFAVALWRTAYADLPRWGLWLWLLLRLFLRRAGGFFGGLVKKSLTRRILAGLVLMVLLWGAYTAGLHAPQAFAPPAAADDSTPAMAQTLPSTEPEVKTLTLYFDDRWSLPEGEALFSLGKNIPDDAGDRAILQPAGGVLIATGIGTTTITLSSGDLRVTVKPAPISLLLLIGQSNMEGNESDPADSVAGPPGQVYSSYGPSSVKLAGIVGGNEEIPVLTIGSTDSLTAAALTGERSRMSRAGTALVYPITALTSGGGGKGGPDSGIAWGWNQATGEKVWTVNAAHSGSSIMTWLPGAENFRSAVSLFRAAERTLSEEVASGHYTVSHLGYFWLQGCSDNQMSAEEYKTNFLSMHTALKSALRCDLGEVEFAAILMVQAADGTENFTTWRELAMDGPRSAQYEMGAALSGDFSDVYVVSTIMESWVYDESEENTGVSAYFSRKYGDFITYPVQCGRTNWPIPQTPEDVKDSIHYNQVGYNEIGLDAAENMTGILNLLKK
ncbi:MAG: sialate O-acetylesterase [Clostridiaceae bacterium]|nr:sialate O-acetylesterase [Clostridiaceae bacterium]